MPAKYRLLHPALMILLILWVTTSHAEPVGITKDLLSVTVTHEGEAVEIKRNQNNFAIINPDFAKTSRPCPPFCINPMKLAEGIETIGELEIIDYLKQRSDGDDSILVIDSRTGSWVHRGTIPGAKNIAWITLSPKNGATTDGIIEIFQKEFNVQLKPDVDAILVDEAIISGDPGSTFDYSAAKTLVLFCNGMWCGQSPNNIKLLLKFGYPPEKIKWYRGGMQNWTNLGFNVVK